ncbi:MAG: elongation factor Ts [Actinomycetota bacterium]|jgi:elongation factor Ts|nr:elongation factor Ts [Actinomycetota bacterium]
MADFTAKDVQALRQATGAGMMDAKRALTENDGDAEAAAKWLREKGLTKAVEKASRANEQGAVAIATTPTAAAIVELKSETDYVAKSPAFKAMVDTLARAVADDGEAAISAHQSEVDDLVLTLKENIAVGRVVRFEAADGAVIDSYLHIQNDRGVNAVLVEVVGGDQALAHDIALHVGFSRPEYLSRDDVAAERVAEERQTLEAISRNEGKPEQAITKIVDGRLNGWYKEHVLLDQPFVKDNKQTITALLGPAKLTRFAQVEIGR